jgi:DNA-binding response OmpR family regulator
MNDIRIVIVEDNPADVLLMQEVLKAQAFSFSLEHHSNGEDAAVAIAAMTEAPELFVLDLNVPRVHGLELLRIVRASPVVSRVPVAILTSSQSISDRTLSEQYGADAYIVKPHGYHEFVAHVGRSIRGLLMRSARGAGYSTEVRRLRMESRRLRANVSRGWPKPLAGARGSVPSHDREGVVLRDTCTYLRTRA